MRRETAIDDPDWGEDEPGFHALERPKPFARVRLAARVVLAAALIAGLSLAAKHKLHPGITEGPAAEASRASASLVRAAVAGSQAGPLLKLEPLEGEAPARTEPPRWSPATGLREDALTGGSFDAIEAPFLRVTMTETALATEPSGLPASLFVALARRAAEMQGLSVIRTGLRGQVETKFGAFEIVEASLSGTGQRVCTGFQSLDARAVRIDGWLCGVLGQAPEPRALACVIDRLTLSGQAAPTVETAFSEAEVRRKPGCASGEPRMPRSEATGSIATREPVPKAAAKPRQTGRSRKNEAQMRQNAKAGQ